VGTRDGAVVYDISYALVTVTDGDPVTNTNSAFALAHCTGCTTVAVSFQVVLVVGQSDTIAPINAAGALNYDCPACLTAAIADQIVVTVSQQPSAQLQQQLQAALARLGRLPQLGADATPAQIAAQVAAVQQQVETTLRDSGILTAELPGGSSSAAASSSSSSSTASRSSSSTARATATASATSGSTDTSSGSSDGGTTGTAAQDTASSDTGSQDTAATTTAEATPSS
jgi:putative peptide zinc metalloprotease protein